MDDLRVPPAPTCRCGEPLAGYSYWDDDTPDAEPGWIIMHGSLDGADVIAASRQDVGCWLTAALPMHDVRLPSGTVVADGACHAPGGS
jgi:hypothetical protein